MVEGVRADRRTWWFAVCDEFPTSQRAWRLANAILHHARTTDYDESLVELPSRFFARSFGWPRDAVMEARQVLIDRGFLAKVSGGTRKTSTERATPALWRMTVPAGRDDELGDDCNLGVMYGTVGNASA